MAAPVGIAVASDGRVYVAQSTTNTITVYAPGSTSVQTTLFGSTLLFKINQASQIAVDASKNLYVAAGNSNDVYEFAPVTGSTPPPPGSYINHLNCTCLNGAFGIAVVP
jgi:DNA-binding beta-propeller fold protein YncE